QTGITVNPVAASMLTVAGFPSPSTAGAAGNFTIIAKDAYGNTATGYTGTVAFSSSDPQAFFLLPNYTFLAGDNGVHTFKATLKTAGNQTIKATDTVTGSISGSTTIAVVPAAASKLVFGQQPTDATAGGAISPAVTVLVEDPFGNVVTIDN